MGQYQPPADGKGLPVRAGLEEARVQAYEATNRNHVEGLGVKASWHKTAKPVGLTPTQLPPTHARSALGRYGHAIEQKISPNTGMPLRYASYSVTYRKTSRG